MSEEQKKEEYKTFDDPKDAGGQSTYKYYCRRCGKEWYSTAYLSCYTSCPNCGGPATEAR